MSSETLKFQAIIEFIRGLYSATPDEFIPIHVPRFRGNEKAYLNQTIDSTYVSSVGEFVNLAETKIAEFTGAGHAIACGNGTLALHTALIIAGVEFDNEVITQPLTFVATGNAIKYCNAHPVFIDVDIDTASLSPEKLNSFLETNATIDKNGQCINKTTQRIIKACLPMHTFGLVGRIEDIKKICDKWNISLVEDAAESIGSYYEQTHTGRFGKLGTLSFNGNKTITCGGGGAIITDDEILAKKAKHITTTAKLTHPWDFYHDQIGYNYRMPNLNAALLVAQLEQLNGFLESKTDIAQRYQSFFDSIEVNYLREIKGTNSNFWLNNILLENRTERDAFLHYSNQNNVMTRPVWILLNKLPAFNKDQHFDLQNAEWLEDRLVNLPSSVI